MRRMTTYLMENVTLIPVARSLGSRIFQIFQEHATMIWEQIQPAKRERICMARPSQCVCASATQAHCLCSRLLLHPRQHQGHGDELYPGPGYVLHTAKVHHWQQLEVEYAMVCSIFPILFVAAFKVFLIRARQLVHGVWQPIGWRFPPLWSYMDDIMCLLQNAPCRSRFLESLDELIIWGGRSCGCLWYFVFCS